MLTNLKEIQKYINTKEYSLHMANSCENFIHAEKTLFDSRLLAETIDKSGIAIVQLNNIPLRSIIKNLSSSLGKPIKDTGIHKKYIARVRAEDNGKYYINSSASQPLHTDEGYKNTFPRYASLYCLQQSRMGGISTIVKVDELLEALYTNFRNKVSELFQPDALCIETVKGKLYKQIFFKMNNGLIGMSYSPILFNWNAKSSISDMIVFINQFVHDPTNQYRYLLKENQLLIMDNCRVLHGRTAFSSQDNRLLLRFWNHSISL